MRRALVLTALATTALPASASAQAPAAPPLQLAVERAGPKRTVVSGARLRLRIRQLTFAPGTTVTVRVSRGGRKLSAKGATLQPTAGGTGLVLLGYRARGAGRISVQASVGDVKSSAATVDVLPRRVGRSSSRGKVRILQRKLRTLGYVVGRRGRWDAKTARAVLALRKVIGMSRTSAATRTVMRRLARGRGAFPVKRRSHGRHIEADISRQVIVLIDEGRVRRIYPMSSGAASTPTVRGSFRVYRKDFGTNAKGMVHASYFVRGYAIHGYKDVPAYSASHGCLRVPIPEALSIFRWVRRGTRVDVYN